MSGILKNSDDSDGRGIRITEYDVIMLRKKRIDSWQNWQEIWSLKYGNEMLAMTNCLTNFSINQYYRKQFHLQKARNNMGILSSLIMTTVLPTAGAGAAVSLYFSLPLLSMNPSECMVCREVRTLSLHMGIGSILPTLVSWHGNMLQAEAYQTYRVPLSQHFFNPKTRLTYLKKTKEVFINTNKHSFKKVGFNWAVQLMLCSFLLFTQQKHFHEFIEPFQFTRSEIEQLQTLKSKEQNKTKSKSKIDD